MRIQDFEAFILTELKLVIDAIISSNTKLNISAKARAGAEISDWLEDKFIEHTQGHRYFTECESAPKGQTKNPWDVKTCFSLGSISEQLWIDFKAFKVTSIDSNPDIGTPAKIINLIEQGSFYLVYVYVYYQSNDNGLEFVRVNESYSKIYFLKDISATFRRNPKNQLQVNLSEPTTYRSREEFISLLLKKLNESHERQIKISTNAISKFDELEKRLLRVNQNSESELIKKIEPIS